MGQLEKLEDPAMRASTLRMQLPTKCFRFVEIVPRLLLISFLFVKVLSGLGSSNGGGNPAISGYSSGVPVLTSGGGGGEVLKRVWSTALFLPLIGGSGSVGIGPLLGILCMAFQATHSMSLPLSTKSSILFQSGIPQGSLPGTIIPPSHSKRKSKSSVDKRSRSRSLRNIFAYGLDDDSNAADDDLSLSSIIPSIYSSGMGRKGDDYSPSLHSILKSLSSNLGKIEEAFIRKRQKSSRLLSKNANVLQSLLAGRSSEGGGGSGSSAGGNRNGNPYMNKDEEEILRRRVMEKVEELDPLMCLPKVLCGYSSRRKQNKSKKRYSVKKTTTTTPASLFGEGYLDDYLELLKIIRPEEENSKRKPSKKGKKKKGSKAPSKKSPKRSKKTNDKRNKKNSAWYSKPDDDDEEEEDDLLQSRSGSSSSESNESEEPLHPPPGRHYESYPVRKKPRDKSGLSRFFMGKKKKKKEKDEDDDDDDDGDEEERDVTFEDGNEFEDDLIERPFDDEDMEYLIEKARMEKLMSTSGAYSNENWWGPFDDETMVNTNEIYKYPDLLPPTEPVYTRPPFDILAEDDTTSVGGGGGGMINWVSNVMSNIMPSMTWGSGSNDEFKNDPFFDGFGRSMGSNWRGNLRMGRSFSKNNTGNSSTPTRKILKPRSGRKLDPELVELFQMEMERRQADSTKESSRDVDPAEKFRIAVEIGRRVSTPSQCDYIYNGCPLSYQEVLVVINEQNFPTTTTAKPKRSQHHHHHHPNNKIYQNQNQASFPYPLSQNYLTIAPPQVISLPYYAPASPHQSLSYANHQHHHQQQIVTPHHYQSQSQPQQQFQYQNQQQQQHNLHQYHQPQQQLQSQHYQYGYGRIAAGGGKPHKTSIHQALASGEQVEINLSYSDRLRQSISALDLDRTGLTATSSQEVSEGDVICKEVETSAPLVFNLDDQPPEHFDRDDLGLASSYTNNEELHGLSSSSSGYKIQKKKPSEDEGHRKETSNKEQSYDDEDELHIGVKIANNKVVKINPSTKESSSMEDASNDLKNGVDSSQPPKIYSLESETEAESHSPSTRAPTPPPFPKKMKKSKLKKYKEILKETFSSPSKPSPPKHQRPPPTKISPILTSIANSINKLRRKKHWKNPPKTKAKLKSKKKSPPKMKTPKKSKNSLQKHDDNEEDDDNSSSDSNSSEGNGGSNSGSDMSSSTSNEKEKIPRKKSNRNRLNLKKKGRNPPNLHKQSPSPSPTPPKKKRKKGVKMKARPPIYPVYRPSAFPPTYGGNHYYHHHHHPPPSRPPTLRPPPAPPTKGSFFSYLFGR